MKKLLFILSFLSQFVLGQNYRFVYEYKFAPMKEKTDSLTTDYMNLDTDGKISYFYNATKAENDSIYKITKLPLKKFHNINVDYSVIKDLKNKTTALETAYEGAILKVPEDEILKWNLSTEKQLIGKWKAQKATANYKGRTWTAWFTTELPFSDGPYKFSGLPGLIVKLNDSGNEHNFELIVVKKLNQISFKPAANPKIVSAKKYATLPPYFSQSAFIEMMNVDKAGIAIKMLDGNTINYSRAFVDENKGKLNNIINRRFGAGNNPIER